jgi:cytochrome c oxidase assembly protein subunit 15
LKLFRALAVTGVSLAVALVVLGSWVRINGAGLACPDWPLCHGKLIPPLEGGVILEWLHRLVALLEGFVLVAVLVAGWRVRREIAGVWPTLLALVAIFFVQVGLGGATVLLGNSPPSVMLHWGTAMALLAALTTLAVLAILAPQPGAPRAGADPVAVGLGIAALFTFATACLGAYVSSSQAGLACPGVPACDGTLLGTTSAQALQMFHRLAAGTVVLTALIAAGAALRSHSNAVRTFAGVGLALVALQITLGALNVLWGLPVALREAHAANATLTFLAFVIAAVLETLAPAPQLQAFADRSRRTAVGIPPAQ